MVEETLTTLTNIKYNGTTWTIRGDFLTPVMDVFVKRLDEALVADGVRIIKSNKARTTLSAPFVNGRRAIVKRYHSKGLREKIKYLFVPSRAKVEWAMMKALSERGISASVPLAYGKRRQWGVLLDESLIIEEIPDSLSFQAHIKRLCSGGPLSRDKILQKREMLRKLAEFIRYIHEKNIDHRDLHGGNILVTETNTGDPVFHLIDLHKASVCGALSVGRRIDDLALQCDIPGFTFSSADCLRFIKHYGNFSDRTEFKDFASKVFKRIKVLRNKRLRSTTRWCLKLSNFFAVYRGANMRIYYRKEYKLADVQGLVKKIESYPDSMPSHVLKRSSKSTVFVEELPYSGGTKKVVVKYNYCRGIFDLLKKTLLGTRSRKAWVAANGLIVRGISTPQPIALVEKRSHGLSGDNFTLTEYIDNTLDVNEYASKYFNKELDSETFRNKRLFIEQLAKLFRSFHDTGIYHSDLAGKNILVKEGSGGDFKMFIIDLDPVSSWKKLTLNRRIKNLSQINRCPDCITNTDRMRFIKTYFRGLTPEARKHTRKIVELTELRRLQRLRREA